jgi:hypothetical protein
MEFLFVKGLTGRPMAIPAHKINCIQVDHNDYTIIWTGEGNDNFFTSSESFEEVVGKASQLSSPEAIFNVHPLNEEEK